MQTLSRLSDLTEIILEQPKTPKGFTVYNAQGKKVASQMIGYENGRAHILVAASLPANSYAVYDVRTGGIVKKRSLLQPPQPSKTPSTKSHWIKTEISSH